MSDPPASHLPVKYYLQDRDIGTRPTRIVRGVILVIYLTAHLVAAAGKAYRTPDTDSYFHLSFVGHSMRGWTVPLLYAISHNGTELVVVQCVIASICWAALAWQVAIGCYHRWVGYSVGAGVLVLGLTEQIAGWNSILGSESLSISLAAAVIAASIALLQAPTTPRAIVWLTTFTLWIFTRQLNMTVCVFILLALFAISITSRNRVLLGMSGILVLLTAWTLPYVTNSRSPIAEYNRMQVVVERGYRHPALLDYFEASGMPDSTQVRSLHGYLASSSAPIMRDKTLRDWLRLHFLGTYLGFCRSHPWWFLTGPIADVESRLLSPNNNLHRYRPVVPTPVANLVSGPEKYTAVEFVLAGIMVAVSGIRRGPDSRMLLAGAVVTTVYLLLMAGWHLSVKNSIRVNSTAAAAVRILPIIVAAWSLDRLLTPAKVK